MTTQIIHTIAILGEIGNEGPRFGIALGQGGSAYRAARESLKGKLDNKILIDATARDDYKEPNPQRCFCRSNCTGDFWVKSNDYPNNKFI